jgi:ribosomal protein L11 methyltransferase
LARLVRLGIRVRADRAEVALAQLLPLFPRGAEERVVDGDVEYSLYAPAGELPRRAEIRALAGDALIDVVSEDVPEGWQRRWHDFLGSVRVGRLVVRPPWVEGSGEDIVIDPGVFFGAGTHATTRMCLELLQDLEPGGALCDWGAGTGVLAVAAARLGWAPVTALELDAAAVALIAANGAANGLAIEARAADLTAEAPPWAPTVCANLFAPLLTALAESVERPPERLLLSGVLTAEAGAVAAAWAARGLREARRLEEDGWAASLLVAA